MTTVNMIKWCPSSPGPPLHNICLCNTILVSDHSVVVHSVQYDFRKHTLLIAEEALFH